MRLGEFDPPGCRPTTRSRDRRDPWSDGEKSKALARKVTQESIVLLKNEGGLLPLDKASVKSHRGDRPAGNRRVSSTGTRGIPPYTVTPLEGIPQQGAGPASTCSTWRITATTSDASNLRRIRRGPCFRGKQPHLQRAIGRGCPPSEGKEAVDRKAIELEQAQTPTGRPREAGQSQNHRGPDFQLSIPMSAVQQTPRPFSTWALQPGGRQRLGRRAVRRLQSGRRLVARGSNRWTICPP